VYGVFQVESDTQYGLGQLLTEVALKVELFDVVMPAPVCC
jgi:hypothetical protein